MVGPQPARGNAYYRRGAASWPIGRSPRPTARPRPRPPLLWKRLPGIGRRCPPRVFTALGPVSEQFSGPLLVGAGPCLPAPRTGMVTLHEFCANLPVKVGITITPKHNLIWKPMQFYLRDAVLYKNYSFILGSCPSMPLHPSCSSWDLLNPALKTTHICVFVV